MILYDKKCNLVGMSKAVLDFLGYEDITEFKTFVNDVADLFQNRPGYIHRFKNFSWIDYVLYSGTPNKNAILLLKNGKELEVKIDIEEIISLENDGLEAAYFRVDLSPIGSNYVPKVAKEEPTTTKQEQSSIFIDPLTTSFNEVNSEERIEFPEENANDMVLFDSFKDDLNELKVEETIPDSLNLQEELEPKEELLVAFKEPFIEEESLVAFEEPPTQESLTIDNVIDYDLTLEALEMDPKELNELILEYCDHAEMILIALEDVLIQKDTEAKKTLLHQLLGASGHFRFDKATKLIETLFEKDDMLVLDELKTFYLLLKSKINLI